MTNQRNVDHRLRHDRHGISPVDRRGYWLLRLKGCGKERETHNKVFTYSVYGGKEKALIAAKRYRDQWLVEHPEVEFYGGPEVGLTPYHPMNRTGVTGVGLQLLKSRGACFVSTWREDGRRRQASRAIKRHGYLGAYRKALDVRLKNIGATRADLFENQLYPPTPPDWLLEWVKEQQDLGFKVDLWGSYEDYKRIKAE